MFLFANMDLYYSESHRKRTHILKIIGITALVLILLSIIIYLLEHESSCVPEKELNQNHTSLVFVQVLFRHGHRTPMHSYSKDPYKNETYEPYGPGALTKNGEKDMCDLGQFLRIYYEEFLGEYHNGIVRAESSPITRNLHSVLLVLATLFSPQKNSGIEGDLNWRPIPYYYNQKDTIFFYLMNCPKYIKLKNELNAKIVRSGEVKGLDKLTQYLEYHSGENITTFYDLFKIYDHLNVQKSMGYKLPEWTNEIFPDPLSSFIFIEFDLPTRSDILKKLSGGFILKRILDSVLLKIKNDLQMRYRKIHLYSGHDFTIANLLGTLGVKLKVRPSYGSFLSVELHKIANNFAIKLLYQDYSNHLPRVLKLPDCEELCPMKQFLELYGKYQASPEDCEL